MIEYFLKSLNSLKIEIIIFTRKQNNTKIILFLWNGEKEKWYIFVTLHISSKIESSSWSVQLV